MRRFTIAPERVRDGRVAFDREETRHLARVLRLGAGAVVVAADGRGHDYTVRIDSIGETATGVVLDVHATRLESPLAITLCQGVTKGDKMEQIVRAATELGVARFRPVLTERTVPRLDVAGWEARARRWQRVAREAAKQCGRAVVPDVAAPGPLAACLEACDPTDLRLCLWEGDAPPLGGVLDTVAAGPASAAVLVGPEGGFAAAEVERARAAGFAVVGLGPRILRTETAGPAVIAVLQYRFGDLGLAAP